MTSEDPVAEREIWIGVVTVAPMPDCDVLSPGQGASAEVLTFAHDEDEYRLKVNHALAACRLSVTRMEDVHVLGDDVLISAAWGELARTIDALRVSRDVTAVRIAMLRTFPRVM